MSLKTTGARLGVATLLTGGAVLLGASPASAHVTVTPTSTAAGSYTVLSFASGHGCGDSPTTEIAIEIPDGINSVAPQVIAGWEIEKVMQELDPPADDGHGGQITERVSQIVYTADEPFPDGYRVSFDLSLQLPADAAGETMAFPTVQSCQQGENPWTQLAADGQSPDDLEYPAPLLEVTEAGADAHGDSDDEAAEEGGTEEEAGDGTDAEPASAESDAGSSDSDDSASASDGSTGTVGWIALVLGAGGLLLGGLAFARSGRGASA